MAWNVFKTVMEGKTLDAKIPAAIPVPVHA